MSNRLAHETSPYLLQHAHNPVDWYPWGPEALNAAREQDRPILLSVGYSACHWCHVMERESFEDPGTAALMNRDFINIKVDREERPDIDEIYMRAVQAFSGGHGGWPMTVFLTPDGRPFLGGTYFPPEARGGLPSFKQVIAHALRMYRERPEQVQKVTGDLVGYLQSTGRLPRAQGDLTDLWLDAVAGACDEDFDEKNAGFGGAPKFPPHGSLAVLLAHHHRTGDRRSLAMVTRTLDAMAQGGMYDLLGGAFARYSVDDAWRVPHFEKMLYDNAQLLPIYTDAYKVTGKAHYKRIVAETLGWVEREMTSPEGAFYASQDADSEGVEGRFFVWNPRTLREVLGVFDGTRAAVLLEVTDEGTFEHGDSVLRLHRPLEEQEPSDRALLERALPRLFEARTQRVPPGTDDKIVSSWNAMMISALARAGATFSEPRWVDAATRALHFLLERATVDGRLHRTWKAGRPGPLGFLDDHALLILAILDVYAVDPHDKWIATALEWADRLVDLFWDEADGGFFYTGSDAEPLVTRSKNMMGGAEPSGNGAAALALLRLGALTGRRDLAARGEAVARAYQPLLERAPRALGMEALAGAFASGRTAEIGVIGPADSPATIALYQPLHQCYIPFAVTARVEPGADLSRVPWMEGRDLIDGQPSAWICEGGACQLPVTAPAQLEAQLREVFQPPSAGASPRRDHAPALPSSPGAWLNTDEPLSLERLRGQVVVLDFWTYCCVNCMHVLPELHKVEKIFAGQPVVLIGVHSAKFTAEQERRNVAHALGRHHVEHPVVLDPTHRLWEEYAVKAWPTVVVLDAQGRIAWRQSGEVEAETLAAVIEPLLVEGREQGTLGAPLQLRVHAVTSDARLRYPGKVAVWPDNQLQGMGADPLGPDARLYISDSGNHRILECALMPGLDRWPVARVLNVFGDGQPGLVDGPGDHARFRGPQGIARFGDTLWVADTENHALRAVDLKTGVVRTLAGTGALGRGRPADPTRPRRIHLRSPWDVAVTAERPNSYEPGAVFVAMAGSHQIWVYLPAQDHMGPFIGSGREDHVDGPPAEAALAQPSGLSLYSRFLFIADSEVSSLRAFDLQDHVMGTITGGGLFDFGDVDGEAERARLQHPLGVVVSQDTVYVADTFNNKIKVLDLNEGELRTLVGGSPDVLSEPGGLAVVGEHLIVADTNNHRLRVVDRRSRKIRDLVVID